MQSPLRDAATAEPWSRGNHGSAVESGVIGPVVQVPTAPVPVLEQSSGTGARAARRTDTLMNAAGISLAAQFLGRALTGVVMTLVALSLSRPLPFPMRLSSVTQTVGFFLTALVAAGTGFLVGRVAPQNAVRGLLLGRAVGFMLGMAWFLVAMSAAGLRSASVLPAYLSMLPLSLFWLTTATTTEILIARWASRRR